MTFPAHKHAYRHAWSATTTPESEEEEILPSPATAGRLGRRRRRQSLDSNNDESLVVQDHDRDALRNILLVLHHREVHSSRRRPMRSDRLPRKMICCASIARPFDSPVSTTQAIDGVATLLPNDSMQDDDDEDDLPEDIEYCSLEETTTADEEDRTPSRLDAPVTTNPVSASVVTVSTASPRWAWKLATPLRNSHEPTAAAHLFTVTREIQAFGEHVAATRYRSGYLPHLGGLDTVDSITHTRAPSSLAVSTISVAFSPNAQTLASTHGDHSVKISCCYTGRLLVSLDGHPRTPWTVKYHPVDSRLVASGCLGYQVRVWCWPTQTCLQMVRLESAIISLAFHPSGTLLAVANGTRLHLWGVNDPPPMEATSSTTVPTPSMPQQKRSNVCIELDQRHMLRCVHFPPNGTSIILGGVNNDETPRTNRSLRRNNPVMSFYLRLWDFDLPAALQQDHGQRQRNPSYTASSSRRALANVSNTRVRVLFSVLLRSLVCSLVLLYREPCSTMMGALMYRPMARRCVRVPNTGCPMASIVPWICYGASNWPMNWKAVHSAWTVVHRMMKSARRGLRPRRCIDYLRRRHPRIPRA
jgi:WD domain, G-beta repeat